MNTRFLAGLLIFAIASVLQFAFPSGHIVNFIFASLIVFASIFRFWELSFFVLAGVFIMNWQPALSVDLAAFVAIPFLAYFFRAIFPWESWIGVIISLFAGFVVLYLVAAPHFIVAAPSSFFLDLFIGSAFGMIIFLCIDRAFE